MLDLTIPQIAGTHDGTSDASLLDRILEFGTMVKEEMERVEEELGEYYLMAGGQGLFPSVTIFYHLVPTESGSEEEPSSRDYPDDRVLLLKISSTLSGLTIGREFHRHARTGVPHEVEKTWGFRSLPCVGGVVTVDLECDAGPSGREPYIRDIFPRRQEMVVHEIMGREAMERASSRTAVTKQWNISGSADVPIAKPLTAGITGGYSETVTEEQARERSKKLSHITEIQHVYHILTGYHIGMSKACMTIQARPFEGEHWELVKGYRLVEGIQEFFLVLNVPDDLEKLRIRACLNIGYRDVIEKTELITSKMMPLWAHTLWKEGGVEVLSSLPTKVIDIGRLLEHCVQRVNDSLWDYALAKTDELAEKWEKWKLAYGTLLEVSKWIAENLTETHLLTTQVCAEAELQMKPELVPGLWMEPILVPGRAVAKTPSRFHDMEFPTVAHSSRASTFENVSRLNTNNAMLFKGIANSSAIPPEKRTTFEKTPYFRRLVTSDVLRIQQTRTAAKDTTNKPKNIAAKRRRNRATSHDKRGKRTRRTVRG